MTSAERLVEAGLKLVSYDEKTVWVFVKVLLDVLDRETVELRLVVGLIVHFDEVRKGDDSFSLRARLAQVAGDRPEIAN